MQLSGHRVLVTGADGFIGSHLTEALVRHGMIDRKELDLFQYAEDPASACALLQRRLQGEPEQAGPSFARSRTRESDDR